MMISVSVGQDAFGLELLTRLHEGSTRAACISRLNWGWILFQAHSLAVGKSQVLIGCWSEALLGSRRVGVSIGQLMTRQLAFARVRESEGLQEGQRAQAFYTSFRSAVPSLLLYSIC